VRIALSYALPDTTSRLGIQKLYSSEVWPPRYACRIHNETNTSRHSRTFFFVVIVIAAKYFDYVNYPS